MDERRNVLLAVNKDSCPENDKVILFKGSCTNCAHYVDHKIMDGQSCIECSFHNKK